MKPSELLWGDKDLSSEDIFVSFYLLNELDKRFIDKEEVKAQLLKEIDNLKFILNEDGIDTSWTKELKKKVEDVFAEALTPKRGILK